MNRTAILPNTTMQTQKKTGDCEKLSENFLCDEIHSNFRVLAMVCPLSDEFRTVFEKVEINTFYFLQIQQSKNESFLVFL